MESSFVVLGQVPTHSEAELAQFQRVLPILREASRNAREWAVMCVGVPYAHTAGNRIEHDIDWNGEIDILLLGPRRIVIYELKGGLEFEIGHNPVDKSRFV